VPEPSGYDKAHEKNCSRGDCVIGVGFDTAGGTITRFLVNLQYIESFLPPSYTEIARFDHNPTSATGHDIYGEGIHIDVVQKNGPDIKFKPQHSHIPSDLGIVIRACSTYFNDNATDLIDLYEGRVSPSNLPSWSP
jgi:hypothetical protein